MLDNKPLKAENIHKYQSLFDIKEMANIYTGKEPTIKELGKVIGSAVYYKAKIPKTNQTQHGLAIACPGGPHDYIIRHMFDEKRISISLFDDHSTRYGFFAENGYFVDRLVAATLYYEFLTEQGYDQEFDRLKKLNVVSLNSYHVNWAIINKAQNDKT